MTTNTPCPSDDDLLGYARHAITLDARDGIDQHLADCDSCPAVIAAAARELYASDASPTEDGAERTRNPVALAAGETLGRYVILDLLGRGGMGIVYAAYDPQLDRRVALKILRPDRRVAALEERFVREGQAMARLSHPNIVTVHDVGVLDGGIFLAMEFVEGETLRGWLDTAPRTWSQILATYVEAGRGLAAAHRAGVVHRDFKPDNVLVGKDGAIRVTDFGLARLALDETSATGATAMPPAGQRGVRTTIEPASLTVTDPRSLLGTPSFMAPEQFRGETATAAADQFAFASALYQALFAQHPFSGGDFAALKAAVLAGAVREAPRSAVPAFVRRALQRALSAAPGDRFAGMPDLLAALAADPVRRAGRIAIVAVPLALAGGVIAWQLARAPASAASPCQAGEARLATVWSATTGSAIRSALAATGAPYAPATAELVVPMLDTYAHGWSAGYLEACEATQVRGDQSAGLLDRRMLCLDSRLRDLGAAATTLAHADRDVLDHAIELTSALRPLDDCADRARLLAAVAPPDTEAIRGRVGVVRDHLATIHARYLAGKASPALLAESEHALADATAVPYPPLLPEAELVVASLQRLTGKLDASVTTLVGAFVASERIGHDELAVSILTQLAQALVDGQKADDALRWIDLAEAKVERLGNPIAPRAKVLEVRAEALTAKFDAPRAMAAALEATHLFEQHYGADSEEALDAVKIQAGALNAASRYADALVLRRRVVAWYETHLGVDHPIYAKALEKLAMELKAVGRRHEALDASTRAVAIDTKVLGAEDLVVSDNLFVTAQIQLELGLREAAVASAERAIQIISKLGDPNNARLVNPLVIECMAIPTLPDGARAIPICTRVRGLVARLAGEEAGITAIIDFAAGLAYENLDRMTEACTTYERADAHMAKVMPDHSDHSNTLIGLAHCLDERGDHVRAVAPVEHALALVEKAMDPSQSDVALVRVELGNTLRFAGQLARSREQLERAVKDLATSEIDPGALLDASFSLGETLRALGVERERADRLVHDSGRALLAGTYPRPALRRRIHAAGL